MLLLLPKIWSLATGKACWSSWLSFGFQESQAAQSPRGSGESLPSGSLAQPCAGQGTQHHFQTASNSSKDSTSNEHQLTCVMVSLITPFPSKNLKLKKKLI